MKKVILIFLMTSYIGLQAVNFDVVIIDNMGLKRKENNDMSKYVSNNISRNSSSLEVNVDCIKNISTTKTDKSILITSDEFGPLPVTLIVKDKNGKEIIKNISEELVSIFEISLNKLDSDSTFTITNTFNEKLVCNKIIKE